VDQAPHFGLVGRPLEQPHRAGAQAAELPVLPLLSRRHHDLRAHPRAARAHDPGFGDEKCASCCGRRCEAPESRCRRPLETRGIQFLNLIFFLFFRFGIEREEHERKRHGRTTDVVQAAKLHFEGLSAFVRVCMRTKGVPRAVFDAQKCGARRRPDALQHGQS